MDRVLDRAGTIFVAALWLLLGVLVGASWERTAVHWFSSQDEATNASLESPAPDSSVQPRQKPHQWNLVAPVSYQPDYRISVDSQGKETLVDEVGHATFEVASSQVALVLVDTWELSGAGEEPGPTRIRQKQLLEKCRRHGVQTS